MAGIRNFKELVAWQRSMELCQSVYLFTRLLPRSERFGLVDQLRRAAVSIPSNIAEGFGRVTPGDFRRHLQIARGSVAELETQLMLCASLGFVGEDVKLMIQECDEISRMLRTLIATAK